MTIWIHQPLPPVIAVGQNRREQCAVIVHVIQPVGLLIIVPVGTPAGSAQAVIQEFVEVVPIDMADSLPEHEHLPPD